jgi:F-type H+-transporting ATPase subunit delta
MPNEKLARRYATAIFQLATDAGAVERVGTDLHGFVDTLRADDAVRRFFIAPIVDRREKATLIANSFAGLHEVALHAALLLIQKRREGLIDQIVQQYDELEREARGAISLRVTTARELSPNELDGLLAKLKAAFAKPFDVTQSVDPKLIGGVRITMGDKLIDGTVAGRLDDLARMLSTN